jgi:hypothetical protein
MASSGMLRRVALVRTAVSDELSASSGSVRLLLVTASVVPSSQILVTLMKETLSYSKTSVLTRATRRNIPEDTILNTGDTLLYTYAHPVHAQHKGKVVRNTPKLLKLRLYKTQ